MSKVSKLLGSMLPSSHYFQPIIKQIRDKYNLIEIFPDDEPIKEIYIGDKLILSFKKTLCNIHGEYAGVYYSGLLNDKMGKSKKQLIKQIKTHPRSLDRKLKKIVDSGIPLTFTDREEPLPPLSIQL